MGGCGCQCRVDHNIKGQGIYAYVVLAEGTKPSAEMKKKLNDVVRNQIGSFAVPDTIHWAPGDLPPHPPPRPHTLISGHAACHGCKLTY